MKKRSCFRKKSNENQVNTFTKTGKCAINKVRENHYSK